MQSSVAVGENYVRLEILFEGSTFFQGVPFSSLICYYGAIYNMISTSLTLILAKLWIFRGFETVSKWFLDSFFLQFQANSKKKLKTRRIGS